MKVIIADAHELFRTLLSRWIAEHAGWTLSYETGSGVAAYKQVLKDAPALVLMDPLLPDMSGFALMRKLRDEVPQVRCLALYSRAEPFLVDQLRQAGFQACIHKASTNLAEIETAMRAMAAGQGYFCANTCRMQNWLYNDTQSFARLLSPREQQVLALIGAGQSNGDIGQRLGLSPATVQTHRRNLFRKLNFHDTPSLMRYAILQGFWHPDYERLKLDPWAHAGR